MGKIIFLGTAGDSFVSGKQIRATGGIIVQIREVQLHIDPGPGALARAEQAGINLRANTAILVSNDNILNCNDVNAVVDAMTYGGADKRGVLVGNISSMNGREGHFSCIDEFYKSCLERTITLVPGQKLGIEDIEVHAVPAITADPNAIGFKIFTDEFVLGYTSSTKFSKELAKEYKGCDILILNVLNPSGEKSDTDLNSDEAVKFIDEAKPYLTAIKHFGTKMIKADPLAEGREIQKKTNITVLSAKDGTILVPSSYSAESRQKRLNAFNDVSSGRKSLVL